MGRILKSHTEMIANITKYGKTAERCSEDEQKGESYNLKTEMVANIMNYGKQRDEARRTNSGANPTNYN